MMTLLERSIVGGVLIAGILLFRPLLRRYAPGWTLSALWLIVALRLLVPLAVSIPILPRTAGVLPPPVQTLATFTFEPDQTMNIPPATTSQFSLDWLHWIWIAGLLLLVLFFLVTSRRSARKFRLARPWTCSDWPMKLRRPVRIAICDAPGTPLTYGIWRPVILLPSALVGGAPQHLQYVLAHELTHIRRSDTLRKTVVLAAVCLHWFNPLAWVMLYFVGRDIELACDEAVLHRFGPAGRPAYAGALIDCAISRQSTPLATQFGQKAVEQRIRWIMGYRKRSLVASLLVFLLIILAAFSVSAMPVQVPLDPYAATFDWHGGWYAILQQYGVTCGADGYPEYDGNPVYAITIPSGGWFQLRWDDALGRADYHENTIPENAVFLQAVYADDEIIDYVPISKEAFYARLKAVQKSTENDLWQRYAAYGLTLDGDGATMRYNGRIVHGLYDESQWVRWTPDATGDPLYLAAQSDDDQNLIGFEELTQQAFESIPMVAWSLSLAENGST